MADDNYVWSAGRVDWSIYLQNLKSLDNLLAPCLDQSGPTFTTKLHAAFKTYCQKLALKYSFNN